MIYFDEKNLTKILLMSFKYASIRRQQLPNQMAYFTLVYLRLMFIFFIQIDILNIYKSSSHLNLIIGSKEIDKGIFLDKVVLYYTYFKASHLLVVLTFFLYQDAFVTTMLCCRVTVEDQAPSSSAISTFLLVLSVEALVDGEVC